MCCTYVQSLCGVVIKVLDSNNIKKIQNIMRKDPGVDGDAQRIHQLSWLLFLKSIDGNSSLNQTIDENYKWSSWTNNNFTNSEIINFIDSELFPYIKSLNNERKSTDIHNIVSTVFSGVKNYMTSGKLLSEVIYEINKNLNFDISDDRHLLGDVYEKILNDLKNAGNSGEFYTPRPLTSFIIDRLNPCSKDRILDPACGTGGFLTCAADYITNHENLHYNNVGDCLYGFEKKKLPHLLCTTNMLMHGINEPSGILLKNSLETPVSEYESSEGYDIIATNPPFGGVEDIDISKFSSEFTSQETADLFIVLIISLLKDKGKAGVVLPDGFLFGTGVKRKIREELLEKCNVHTIVRLPKGVFYPYTNIASNILFFTKGKATKKIRYIELEYPEGYKSFSKKKPIQYEHFKDIIDNWESTKNSNICWTVDIEEIKHNDFSLDFKNPMKKARSFVDTTKNQLLEKKYYSEYKDKLSKLKNLILTFPIQDTVFEEAISRLEEFSMYDNSRQHLEDLVLSLGFRGYLSNTENITHKHDKSGYFSIPNNWDWQCFEEVGTIISGGTPSTSEADYYSESEIPWLTPADLYGIDETFISKGARFISKLGLQKSSSKLIPAGGVLFSSRAPIGHVAIAKNDLCTNQGFKSIIPYDMELNKYFYYYLKFVGKFIDEEASGTTFKEVSMRQMKKIPVPISTKSEMVDIALKLDELFELITKITRLTKNYNNIKKQNCFYSIRNLYSI